MHKYKKRMGILQLQFYGFLLAPTAVQRSAVKRPGHGKTFALYSLLAVKVVKIRYDFNKFKFHFHHSNLRLTLI